MSQWHRMKVITHNEGIYLLIYSYETNNTGLKFINICNKYIQIITKKKRNCGRTKRLHVKNIVLKLTDELLTCVEVTTVTLNEICNICVQAI